LYAWYLKGLGSFEGGQGLGREAWEGLGMSGPTFLMPFSLANFSHFVIGFT
jgi:hypothetical protein